MNSYKITEAEKSVLEVLWENPGHMQTCELLERMNAKGKNWKRQTLNTLLFRLEEKSIVNRKRAYVAAALTEQELLQKQTQGILDNLYGGKFGNFCAALIGKEKVEEGDKDRLYALIDGHKDK